jgi:hypothetical protein
MLQGVLVYGCADAGATAKDALSRRPSSSMRRALPRRIARRARLACLDVRRARARRVRGSVAVLDAVGGGGGALAAVFWLIQLMPGFVEKALVAPAFKVGQVAAGGAMQAGSAVVAPAQPAPAVAASAPAPQPGFRFLPAAAPAPADSAAAAPSEEAARLAVAGVARRGRMITVTLTDGTVWTEGSPELERVDRAGAVIAGKRLPFVRPAASAKPGQAASAPAPAVAAATPGAPAVAAADEGSWQRGADGFLGSRRSNLLGAKFRCLSIWREGPPPCPALRAGRTGGGAGLTRFRMQIVPCEVCKSQAGRASVLVCGLGSFGI